MENRTHPPPAFMLILISAILGCLGAIIISFGFLKILLLPFEEQLLSFAAAWLSFTLLAYPLIRLSFMRSRKFQALLAGGDWHALIRKGFLAVFLFFPFGLIAWGQSGEFTRVLIRGKSTDFIGWLSLQRGIIASLVLVVYVVLLIALFLFFWYRRNEIKAFYTNLSDHYYIFAIVLASLLIRLLFIHLFDTQPSSDFANINTDASLIASNQIPTNVYTSSHVMIAVLYGYLYKLFGTNLLVIKFFHSLIYSLSGILIFYAGKRFLGNKLWAGVAALLLVLWPSLAVYSNVLTPEHMFIFMESAFIFIISDFFQKWETNLNEKGYSVQWLVMFLMIGSSLGLSDMFRPFGLLFFVAFLITLFIYKNKYARLPAYILGISIMTLSFWFFAGIPTNVTNHYNIPYLNYRACNLLTGLNFESVGRYNEADNSFCVQTLLKSTTNAELNSTINAVTVERLRQGKDALLLLAIRKNEILWVNSNEIIFWAVQYSTEGSSYRNIMLTRVINTVDFILMFLAIIMSVIGLAVAFCKDLKPVIFFCLVSFFGFNLMEVFFEIQARYRTVVMPLVIIFACWAFAAFEELMDNKQADHPGLDNTLG